MSAAGGDAKRRSSAKAGSTPPRRPTVAEARAAEQAQAAATRAARQANLDARFGEGIPGRPLIVGDVGATVVFTAVSILGVAAYDTFATAAAVVDLALFVAGLVLFLVALWTGAQRSREAEMDVAGWFFLSRVAPPEVRRPMLGSLGIQVIVGVAAALGSHGAAVSAGDKATKLAFGTLVPVAGLALNGVWCARYGAFPPRRPDPSPSGRRR